MQAACTSHVSEWCRPSGVHTSATFITTDSARAAVIDGSIIQASAASCAAALTLAVPLTPMYSLFAGALTNTVAGLGAALQTVALDAEFVDLPCKDSCRTACHLLKAAFLPPGL